MVETKQAGRATHNRHQTREPQCAISYNSNETGVDRADQMLAYYPFQRKTLKWWKKLFLHLCDGHSKQSENV